jgi:phosphoserine phosphatase
MASPRFGTVIFDCDSTLSSIEGIDELAAGHREEIAALTAAAMSGAVALETVYGARLALLRPSRGRIEALAAHYVAAAVPGAQETVRALLDLGVQVRIVSGGIRQAVLPFAEWLGLDDAAVAAVALRFSPGGEYEGFDESSPLARSGGKRTVIESWRGAIPGPVLLVGDGVTDLEARPAVDRFLAFAGVVDRPAVTAAADAVLRGPSLLPILEQVLHPESG